uniref:39S ribosomal protein L52, mitochondrial n=1 Tax=Macrostomum lignano TaxID=282301 RepID=A0A1I8HLK9_9PLAT
VLQSTKIRAVSLAAGGSWTSFIIATRWSLTTHGVVATRFGHHHQQHLLHRCWLSSASRRNRPNYPALDESAIREQFVSGSGPAGRRLTRLRIRKPGPYTRIVKSPVAAFKRSWTFLINGEHAASVVAERERRAQDRYEHGRSVSRLQMKLRLKEELANRLPQRLETPPSMDEGGEADSNSGSD